MRQGDALFTPTFRLSGPDMVTELSPGHSCGLCTRQRGLLHGVTRLAEALRKQRLCSEFCLQTENYLSNQHWGKQLQHHPCGSLNHS